MGTQVVEEDAALIDVEPSDAERVAIRRVAPTERRARWIVRVLVLVALALTLFEISTGGRFLRQQHTTISAWLTPVYSYDYDGNISNYKCNAWRGTTGCSANGLRNVKLDMACDAKIEPGTSGYCEIQHKTSGRVRRVLLLGCSSARVAITCESFAALANYGPESVKYTHDAQFSFDTSRQQLITSNKLATTAIQRHVNATEDAYFARGIVMVIYEKMLPSVYASIRSLRSMGCSLPIELFYIASETKPSHPILQALVDNHEVYLREITDSRASSYYTKLYAVFYSAFDQILFLDADNYATRDPMYLFFAPEYQATGAMFWPDYWHPAYTMFKIYPDSLVWQVFDTPFVDMFEQESGQILINRRVHMKALNVLMYYGFTLPRFHQDLQLVWGDKDLFRLAWLKTGSTFHMIPRPPGTAGMLNEKTNKFCGVTMAQHDTHNQIVFLHRNLDKLVEGNVYTMWSHIEQFKLDAPVNEYRITFVGDLHPQLHGCWGAPDWKRWYTMTPLREFVFNDMEPPLLRWANEALAMAKAMKKDGDK